MCHLSLGNYTFQYLWWTQEVIAKKKSHKKEFVNY